jgi:hypothetical protein
MSIPCNRQASVDPWGATPSYLVYGAENGPFTIVDTVTPLPVKIVSGQVTINNTVVPGQTGSAGTPGAPSNFVLSIQGVPLMKPVQVQLSGHGIDANQPLAVVSSVVRQRHGIQKTTITSSASETTIVSATQNQVNDLYGLVIANTSASAATVTIKDSTGGTTRFILAVPAGETRGFMVGLDGAIPQYAGKNNNWTATCTSVASIEITALFLRNNV